MGYRSHGLPALDSYHDSWKNLVLFGRPAHSLPPEFGRHAPTRTNVKQRQTLRQEAPAQERPPAGRPFRARRLHDRPRRRSSGTKPFSRSPSHLRFFNAKPFGSSAFWSFLPFLAASTSEKQASPESST